ncbi:MAG: response regulator [Caedimonadaceae bacterium]|nr:MAG: response regulator [Caedimonadaceae bacterium]
MKSILPYFIPTEVILIDDDITFLESTELHLASLNALSTFFNKPKKAIDYIEQHNTVSIPKSLDKIHSQIYSSDRFRQISTIIVDYDMPNMNGLEVCRQITSPYIHKVMLTGAATHKIAIDAFNEGIIDQFIQKNDPDVFAKLQNAIINAQEKYFEVCTPELMYHIQSKHPEVSILQNPAFVELFRNTTRENKVVESYLLDTMGSFLFLPDSGNASAIFIFNEETLEFQEDMIPEADRNTDLAQEVYSKNQTICFYPFNHQEKYDPENWKSYLKPLKRLGSDSLVFYVFDPDLTNLDQNQIISFKDYRLKAGK